MVYRFRADEADMKSTVKCLWCGRQVGWTKENKVKQHTQSPKVMCHGSGVERKVVEARMELTEEIVGEGVRRSD